MPGMGLKTRPRADVERALRRLLAADPRDVGRFLERCAAVSDWAALADQAERHGVLGILQRTLAASAYRLPPEAGDVIRRRAALQRLLQRRNDEVLSEILAALDDAGVEAVALKGPVLGERLYGDPTLRVAWDLDLMVALRDVPAAKAVLDDLGYLVHPVPADRDPEGHHIKASRDDSPLVELHFRLTSNFGALIPSEEFLSRALPYRTARGASCRVLAPEDELFYLILHAAEHLFARLAWLLDIKVLLAAHPGLDWAVVADRARAHGVENAFGFATDLIARRMEIATPPGATGPGTGRARAAVAGALLSAEERSREGASRKVLGHFIRAILTDKISSGARYLWRQFRRVRAARRGG